MPPSLFTLHEPASTFHVLFGIYAYLLPLLLYAVWASLSLYDLAARDDDAGRAVWGVAVLGIPWLGGAAYLLTRATSLTRRARVAAVVAGLVVWALPLAYGLPLVWGPLGPKAL
jgi:hypothetical protein